MNEREICFLSFILFKIFSDYFSFSFIASFIKPYCCLHRVFLIRYSFFSLYLVLFNFFSHSSLQTFLFLSFEILFQMNFTSTYSAFSISQLLLFFSTCSIERLGQTCMTKEQSEILMLYPFARPLLHSAVRCTRVQSVIINSVQPDFDIEIFNCSCSVMRGHYSSILLSNERRWTELRNNVNYIL